MDLSDLSFENQSCSRTHPEWSRGEDHR